MPVLEGFQTFCIETADALAHGLAIKADPGCNRRGSLAATGPPDDLRTLYALGRSRVGVGQLVDRRTFRRGQVP